MPKLAIFVRSFELIERNIGNDTLARILSTFTGDKFGLFRIELSDYNGCASPSAIFADWALPQNIRHIRAYP